MSSSSAIQGQPDAKKRRDERARRREERANGNINWQEYINHIVYVEEGDTLEPYSCEYTNKSLKEKNIECGDLVWLNTCFTKIGVVSSVTGDTAVVKLYTALDCEVVTLFNSDIELKRKAKNTKSVEQFRL